jgi:hypothetical protein
LLTRDFASLTHPEDLDLNLKLRDELLAGRRESFVIEKRYLKKNGDIVWTRHSVSAPHTAAGDIATLMVVAEVRIAPRVEGGTLELEVADNGRGIRATEVTGIRGLGLLGMRERALAAGGGIIVEGPAGGGAIGTARLPIVQPGNAS